MQFLRTMFWVILAVLGAIFALNNWTPVTINLWSGLVLDTRLPVLMIGSFLLGLVPMFIIHRATRWSLRRRLDSSHRALSDFPASPTVAVTTVPPGAAPIVPPAGVA